MDSGVLMSLIIDLKGPFFRTDVGRVVKDAINKAVVAVANEGVKDVKAQLFTGHGKDTGQYRASIKTKKSGASSTVFSRDARKSTWLQGTSQRNRNTRFKGYGLWTDAAAETDDKAQGIADKIIHALTKELS